MKRRTSRTAPESRESAADAAAAAFAAIALQIFTSCPKLAAGCAH